MLYTKCIKIPRRKYEKMMGLQLQIWVQSRSGTSRIRLNVNLI